MAKKFKKIKWVLTYERENNVISTQHYSDKDLTYWLNKCIKDGITNYRLKKCHEYAN